ncbi:hypothetical protein BRARA_A01476 [Brassica rapa]|uniref:Manganese-dependent ADP-ribose/CDP-alcohol diphosphatase n=1 Tax=Brassica campestris TaxID=3711 RepID=A0A398AP41_BRACM|nr:hypothetical protein BRARA_A01476 [Brassica rapa]
MGSVTTQPLFSFGVIADVQYADIPDGRSFLGTPRYYRNSILVLQKAVQAWNQHGHLKFVINMGDIVDGFCPKDQSLSATKKLVNEFEKFKGPVYHMIGNHCLYNLPRRELLPLLNIPSRDGDNNAYYEFSPTPEYRVVVLDGYDISAVGWPEDHPKTMAALKILEEKNPNSEKNSPEGLVGVERRFVKYNGGVGEKQLEWLDGVLKDATELNQRVIVCGHVPMSPGCASSAALLWNFDEVMSVIHKYDVVKVCLSGHDHKGGYFVDSRGVHHRSLEAALECPPVLEAGKDMVRITWMLKSSAKVDDDAAFKTVEVKLCYAPISQVDRPWRKTHNELSRDRSCPHKIVSKPYDNIPQSLNWTIDRETPHWNLLLAYGQSSDAEKTTNLFIVEGINGRHTSLDIASICFSVFSFGSLLVFLVKEKKKANLQQRK